MIKEHPILFNAEMVKAILEGRKTQTRRVVKVQPSKDDYNLCRLLDTTGSEARRNIGKYRWGKYNNHTLEADDKYFSNPFGKIGDRIWVRETLIIDSCLDMYYKADNKLACPDMLDTHGEFPPNGWRYREDEYIGNVPSIHMPRWASRITLEITNIRVERLQDITTADAMKEGVFRKLRDKALLPLALHREILNKFKDLWNSIYGGNICRDNKEHFNRKREMYSWDKNPWVWVVEFKRVEV